MGVNTQERFTRGQETRLQPNRQRRDFRDLMDDERELAALTEAFNAKVTPAIAAEIMWRPDSEMAAHYPHVAADLWSIKHVNTFKSKSHFRQVQVIDTQTYRCNAELVISSSIICI